MIEEVIRDTLGVITLAGFLAAIFAAAHRFVGDRGKEPARGAAIFAGVAALILAALLSLRRIHEAYIAKLVAPLNRFTASPEANWPQQAAIGILRLVIVTTAIVLIIQIMPHLLV